MSLPSCPTCRYPLHQPDPSNEDVLIEVPRRWECLRPVRRTVTDQNQAKIAEREAKLSQKAGHKERPRLGYSQREPEPCLGNNAADDTVCSSCNQARLAKYARELCPNPECGEDLPTLPNVDQIRPGTITVSGVSGAGKTHYIVALEDWWSRNLGDLGWTDHPAMGSKSKALFAQFKDDLLIHNTKLSATEIGAMQSFSWLFMPSFGSTAPSFLLTLPDVSGERLIDLDALLFNRHYDDVDGIIMLLDGERIAIAQGLADTSPGVRNAEDHIKVIKTMIQYLRQDLSAEDLARRHIAVCVNKVDYLKELDDRWANLTNDWVPDHRNGFDWFNCQRRSDAIKAILSSDESTRSLCRTLERSFGDNVMYFAVATLGSDTSRTDQIDWNPQGVGDPFLWMLFQLQIIGDNTVDAAAQYD